MLQHVFDLYMFHSWDFIKWKIINAQISYHQNNISKKFYST